MGLAPYASEYDVNKCYKIFSDILTVKNLDVVYKNKPEDLYFHFKEKFKYSRFDGIAGGLQKFLEVILERWFEQIVKKTKVRNIYFSGGVAQNIKAGLYLSKNKKINKIYIPPAAGDTTISIGAAYKLQYDFCKKNNLSINKNIKPIDNLYLGNEIHDEEILEYIKKYKLIKKLENNKKYFCKKNSKRISKRKYSGKMFR